jgi:hypothetical protein
MLFGETVAVIVRTIRNTQIHCVGRMHCFFMTKRVVQTVTTVGNKCSTLWQPYKSTHSDWTVLMRWRCNLERADDPDRGKVTADSVTTHCGEQAWGVPL